MDDIIGPDEGAFLGSHSRAFLLGVRADGSPSGWPMVAFYTGHALEFSTYRRSQKVRDFERRPEAGCVIAPNDHDRALVLRGAVEIRQDQRAPSTGTEPPADTKAKVGGMTGTPTQGITSSKRVILRFMPTQARFVDGFAVTDDGEADPGGR